MIGNNILSNDNDAQAHLSMLNQCDHVAPAAETRKQKRNLYFMAIALFVLFYPFPASRVLYWASANVLQVFQQLVSKK